MKFTKRNHTKPKEDWATEAADDGRDEESQKIPPRPAATAKCKSPQSRGYCRSFLIRKILSVFIIDDGSGDETGGGVVGWFQDMVVGTVLSVLLLSFLLWLDFVGALHLQSTHTVRDKAFAILNDPETLKDVEEASGLKFMKREELDAIFVEIRQEKDMFVQRRDILDGKSKEIEEHSKKELDPLREEAKALETELVKYYCGSCTWKGRQGDASCDERVAFVNKQLKWSKNRVKTSLVKNKECIKQLPERAKALD